MKNVAKLFGITALVAVIVFSMASCASSGGGSRGTDAWPADDVWNALNLYGLQQPPKTEKGVKIFRSDTGDIIYITLYANGKAASEESADNLGSQIEGIYGWSVTKLSRGRSLRAVASNYDTGQRVSISANRNRKTAFVFMLFSYENER